MWLNFEYTISVTLVYRLPWYLISVAYFLAQNMSSPLQSLDNVFQLIEDHMFSLLHRILTKKAIAANGGKPLPLYQKALCGLTAGAIGACVGTPADLALVRMQADATLPPSQRRNYKNVFHALYRIIADEGVLALWKGAGPTVVRAMALNMGMLASYDQSVEFFRDSLGWDETRAVVGKMIDQVFIVFNCFSSL